MPTRERTGYQPPKLKYKSTAYAQSPNEALPRQYFVCAALGPRGSGKTHGVCQMIKAFEKDPPQNPDGSKQFVRTLILSPTYEANECFKALRSVDEKDVYKTYDKSVLQTILDSIEQEKEATEKYQQQLKLFRKWTKARSEKGFSDQELLQLEELDFEQPRDKPRYPDGASNFLIVDDLAGGAVFKNGVNPFTTLLLKNRHVRVNIILCVQSMKALPKTVRGNVSVWIIHRFGQKSILQDLYEEAGSDLSEKQFFELFDEATNEPHQSLVIDYTKPRDRRYSQSFHTVLKP